MCGGLGEHVPSEQACALDFFSFFFLFPWVFMAAHGLSLVATSRDYSLAVVGGLLIAVASHCSGFSCHRAQALDRGLPQLWRMGSAGPQHVESSQTRDQTCGHCIGRQILNHWTTREVHSHVFLTDSI